LGSVFSVARLSAFVKKNPPDILKHKRQKEIDIIGVHGTLTFFFGLMASYHRTDSLGKFLKKGTTDRK